MHAGLVSVLLPNYNGEKHLEEAIDSVLGQTYANIELIIVDDGSSDYSKTSIERYTDNRIKKIYLKRGKHISYALNQGLKYASGEYIARIDSDDIWEKDKLEKQITYMNDHQEVAACFTKISLIDGNGTHIEEKEKDIYNLYQNVENKTQEEWVRYFFYTGNCLCHPSVVIRKSMWDAIGCYYGLPYVTAEDLELWMRISLKFPIYIMEETLIRYRWEISEVKVSGIGRESQNAFGNVHLLIKNHFLDSISDDDFIRCFGEQFKNQESSTSEELECEKALLFFKESKNAGNVFCGFQRIENILNKPWGEKLLHEKYDFDLKKYYNNYKKTVFVSLTDEEKIKVHDQLMGELEHRQKYIEDLQELVAQYELRSEENKQEIEALCSLNAKLQNSNNELMNSNNELKNRNSMLAVQNVALHKNVDDLQKSTVDLQNYCEDLKNINTSLQKQKDDLQNSLSWKVTKPLRVIANGVQKNSK